MIWHRVVFDNKQINVGELFDFQNKFRKLYLDSGSPKGMSLLCDMLPEGIEGKSHKVSVYFSPGCLPYVSQLISDYSGEPCKQPDSSDVAFLTGDPDDSKSHQ